MSASNSFEQDLLKLLFNGTTIAGYGDAGGIIQQAGTSYWTISLHTAMPGENATDYEVVYGGYNRMNLIRTSAAWTVASDGVRNAAAFTFPQCTNYAAVTATHFGITCQPGTTGNYLFGAGALVTPISITNGVIPQVAANNIFFSFD